MKIGVIGSGSIGPDLAYGFASALARREGGTVHLVDVRQEALDAGLARIRGYAQKGVARGKLSPKAAAAIARLAPQAQIQSRTAMPTESATSTSWTWVENRP